jgi:RNA ligase (TIGR02306 family)
MRKLATIRKIDELNPIEGADAIECATVGGWKVVVKKGEFNVGDVAVYCEIDSWIPHEMAPFLSKGKEPREFEGVKGERLRTIKLRGQLSQGLLLPLGIGVFAVLEEGTDVSELLNIIKWEKPMNAQLAGVARGNFPTLIPKTDQERCQNMKRDIMLAIQNGVKFEVTEKMEGSSMTVYLLRNEFGVCSRNMDLKETEGNSFWETARRDGIEEKMRAIDINEPFHFAIQGELIGPGIQGNIYKLIQPEFLVFDVYDINEGRYFTPKERHTLIDHMGLKHVPIIAHNVDLYDPFGLTNIEQILRFAEGKSKLADTEREGIVFKQCDGNMTFKAISNLYLINEK